MDHANYFNLFQNLVFNQESTLVESLIPLKSRGIERILLKEDSQITLPISLGHILLICLRGKALFTVKQESFTMHAGSIIEIPPQNTSKLEAEVNSVFIVISFHQD